MDEIIEVLTSAGLSASYNNKKVTLNNTRQEICRVWEGVLSANITSMEGLEFESILGTFYDRIECGYSSFLVNEGGATEDDQRDYSFPGATLVDAIPEQEMYIQHTTILSDNEVNAVVDVFFPGKNVMVYFLHNGKEVLTVERTEGKIYYFNDRRAGPSKTPDMDLGEWLDH